MSTADRDPAAPQGFRLNARGIRKSFNGVEVLHGVDLDIRGGRVVALLGENGAGKSTLVRILAGAERPDAGELELDGRVHHALDPVRAREAGVRMIYQEFTDARDLTVAENISLGRWPRRRGLVDWAAMRRRARDILADLGVELDVDARVGDLKVGERQVCEVARALADEARCLVLDEPTAALSSSEVERLFGFLDRLRDSGVAIIYITHRLDEVPRVADEVVVLRDGQLRLTAEAREVTRDDMVTAMVGRRPSHAEPADRPAPQETATRLLLRGATSGTAFRDVDLSVGAGEVLAVYGKLGSGATEVAEVVYGLRALTEGELLLSDRPVRLTGPADAIAAGIAFLPGDRQREGALMGRPTRENLAAASWHRLAVGGVIRERHERAAYERWREPLRIKVNSSPDQPIATLSGGNQQKVLVGRWLERGSDVLVLVEPTRGVDVGSREDIYHALRARAAQGAAVLIATSDYEEVVQVADRAVVLAHGGVVATLTDSLLTAEQLTAAAAG